jgi:hypothetical protein
MVIIKGIDKAGNITFAFKAEYGWDMRADSATIINSDEAEEIIELLKTAWKDEYTIVMI